MNILIALFGFVLILLCLFTLLVVMVQRPKGDGGMGAALGGGSMEAAFGAETGSLLQKITIYAVIGFFVLTFLLYLGNLASLEEAEQESGEGLLSEIADETPGEGASADSPLDAALQQVIEPGEAASDQAEESVGNVTEEVITETENAAEELQQVVEEAEEAGQAVEETTTPNP